MSKLEVLEKKYEILDANNEMLLFKRNIDVLNECFGANRSLYCKAVYPDKKNSIISAQNTNENLFVWLPKMYSNSSLWKNSLLNQGEIITEIADEKRKEDWIESESTATKDLRIVFAKLSRKDGYHFIGVYETSKISFCKHEYHRIATKIKLIGNPVYRIELLDDIRFYS